MQDTEFVELESPQDFSKPRRKQTIIAVVCVLLVALLAVATALLVKTYVLATFIVDGVSMYPTLDGGGGATSDSDRTNGEVLYLNKLAKIGRGDIVVFNTTLTSPSGEERSLVKRVIAVGGDHLQITGNVVYLNGQPLDEPYINGEMFTSDVDVYVEEGHVFCMGDNRNNSQDSRVIGQISLDDVVGKCFLIKGLDGKLRKP